MADATKFKIGKNAFPSPTEFQAEEYATREEAEIALEAMENSEDYTIIETR